MIYSVIVDISNSQVDRVFDYKGDGSFLLGQRVEVNFAGRLTEGFIVEQKETTDCPPDKLKEIVKKKDSFSAISPQMLELGTFMQKKYHLRFIDILRLFVPAEMRKDRVSELIKRQIELTDGLDFDSAINSLRQSATKQRQLLQFLKENESALSSQLTAQFGASALNSLLSKGFLVAKEVVFRRTPELLYKQADIRHELTQRQSDVVKSILSDTSGSGKTEVYLRIIEQLVGEGKNCIMLVPEISLTPNMMRLFRQRFDDKVALLHSGLSAGERYDEWLRLKKGEARIAIGARSAIFAPLENLGAIIIDEEHDGSYISDFNPRYDTLEVADFRRSQNNCLLILGSATPSLVSYHKAMTGKLKLLQMPNRINQRPLPVVEIVDMINERRRGNKGIFSDLLIERLKATLEKGNQAILFLNRRGYSSFLMCTKCGYVAKCTECDVSLTVHREESMLKCHYCNKRFHLLTECPECHEKSFRQGKIGTQQVVDLIAEILPNARVLRMDSDTTQTKLGHDKLLSAFSNREADILIGTQMVAKGHDFPSVTLVGILDGDQSLYYNNYLSTERTFQLLTQVAGRSGRDLELGSVVLQTYTPEHYCLQLSAKQDYLAFYRHEINLREAAKFPPFAVIARILYQGENQDDCIAQLTEHYAQISSLKEQKTDDFIYLDKMRCPLKRAEGKFRFQILMKLENSASDEIITAVYKICDQKTKKDVQVFAEINPQNLS